MLATQGYDVMGDDRFQILHLPLTSLILPYHCNLCHGTQVKNRFLYYIIFFGEWQGVV
jgi:hypothetical protein